MLLGAAKVLRGWRKNCQKVAPARYRKLHLSFPLSQMGESAVYSCFALLAGLWGGWPVSSGTLHAGQLLRSEIRGENLAAVGAGLLALGRRSATGRARLQFPTAGRAGSQFF